MDGHEPCFYARNLTLYHEPWVHRASLPEPNRLQRVLQGSMLSRGAKVAFTRENSTKEDTINLTVASYSPDTHSKVRVGSRTQVFLSPAKKVANILRDLCSAGAVRNTNSSFKQALERSWDLAFHHTDEPKRVPCVSVLTPSDTSGVREVLLDFAMARSLGEENVVSISTGRIHAIAETMFKGRVDEALHHSLYQAVLARPSVVLFEDLHRLTPAEPPPGEEAGTSRTAKLILDLLNMEESQILVVVVMRSLNRLTPTVKLRLSSSEGGAVVVPVGLPDATERQRIITAARTTLTKTKGDKNIDDVVRALASDTAGASALEVALHAKNHLLRGSDRDSAEAEEEEGEEGEEGEKKEEEAGIIGHSDVLQLFDEAVVWPREYSHVYRHFYPRTQGSESTAGVRLISGLLLYGPPGTGKTHLARVLGKRLKCRTVVLSIAQAVRGEVGAGEEAVRRCVAEAKRFAPSVLFIDEFQAIFTARSTSGEGGGSDVGQSLSSALASAFDSIHSWNLHAGAGSQVLVLGATNEPWAVDEGFLRQGRFDRAVLVGPLKIEERQHYLLARVAILKKSSLKRAGVKVVIRDSGEGENTDKDEGLALTQLAQHVAALTERYSGADLQLLAQRALQAAVQRASTSLESLGVEEVERAPETIDLCKEDFMDALTLSRPSISEQDLETYRRWGVEHM